MENLTPKRHPFLQLGPWKGFLECVLVLGKVQDSGGLTDSGLSDRRVEAQALLWP